MTDKEKFLAKFGVKRMWISEDGRIYLDGYQIPEDFTGISKFYHEDNGNLFMTCTWKDGFEHGKCKTYNEKGILILVETFDVGYRHVEQIEYNDDGSLKCRRTLKDDELKTYTEFGETGKILESGEFD